MLGLLLLLVCGITACRVSPDGSDGTATVSADPIDLWLLRGQGFDLVAASRELEAGEQLQRRQTGKDDWSTMSHEGNMWMFEGDIAQYQWYLEGAETVAAERAVAEISVEVGDSPSLWLPDELVELPLDIGWDLLPLVSMAIAVQRSSDGAWLESYCADYGYQPCWREEQTTWQIFPNPEAGTEIISYWSEPGVPRRETLEMRLLTKYDGQFWTLDGLSTQVVELGRSLAWGDLHGHSNLSYDGCEDSVDYCVTSGDKPGEEVFFNAEENGLDFAALTDHAEFESYYRYEDGLFLDIYEETLALAVHAESGPVLPIVGYEWSARYKDAKTKEMAGGHRTVLFESSSPCVEYWIPACQPTDRKEEYGLERYDLRDAELAGKPQDLLAALEEADEICGETRHLSYFHHPAVARPIYVDWGSLESQLEEDLVVEIHSEHGSSECFDLELQGCDWGVDADLHYANGSVQYALQLGRRLGFVGGTDNHESAPGSVEDGAGPILGSGKDFVIWHLTGGSLTGVYYAGSDVTRSVLFDGIEARNTMAASWLFDEVAVAALGEDGNVYLPGADIPAEASPLQLLVRLEDEALDSWSVELLDPWNDLFVDIPGPCEAQPFDLAAGEARYVRLRAWVGDSEQRVWASPFFGQDGD